jgi:hypothetical protein
LLCSFTSPANFFDELTVVLEAPLDAIVCGLATFSERASSQRQKKGRKIQVEGHKKSPGSGELGNRKKADARCNYTLQVRELDFPV